MPNINSTNFGGLNASDVTTAQDLLANLAGTRAEVVIGRGNYFNHGNLTRLHHGRMIAQTVSLLAALHPEWSPADRSAIADDLRASLPPFEAATIPGQLTNATAGRLASTGSRLLTSAALRGAFGSGNDSLNDVNALSIAAELGVEVAEQHRAGASDYTNLLAVTVRDPAERTVVGTVLGADHRAWLVRVHGLPLEIELGGRLLLLRNDDVPGMVGRVGTLLGDAGINIANMTLSRSAAGGDAMMAPGARPFQGQRTRRPYDQRTLGA